MTDKRSMIFAARDEITSRLNKSVTGFFLTEYLKKGIPAARRVYESTRLVNELVIALDRVKTIEVMRLPVTIAGKSGCGDYWLRHRDRHVNDPLPDGVLTEEKVLEINREAAQHLEVQKVANEALIQAGKKKETQEKEAKAKANAARAAQALANKQKSIQKTITENKMRQTPATKVTKLEPATTSMVNTEQMRKQAAMMLKQADEMDRQGKASEVLTEVKRLRIELARNVAIGQRLLGEQMDCFDAIEKLNEELRKLIGEAA